MARINFHLYSGQGKELKHISGLSTSTYFSVKDLLLQTLPLEKFQMAYPTVRVALDQSTSATGVYITNKERDFHLCGSIERGTEPKESFLETLKNQIIIMIEDCTVDLFVTESVLNFDRDGGRAKSVLRKLKSHISKWSHKYTNLAATPDEVFRDIPAPMWKKHVYDKSKGTHRFNDKSAIASDLVDKYPFLENMFWEYNSSSDYDAFDAIGIYEGFIAEFNYDAPVKTIAGAKMYNGKIVSVLRLLPEDATQDDIKRGFERQIHEYGLNVAVLNNDESWYANMTKASSNYKFLLTQVSGSKYEQTLRIQYGMPLNGGVLVAYVVRKSCMSDNELEYLKSTDHVELISW